MRSSERIEGIVGAIPLALIVASIPRQISIDFASKEAMIALDRGHDQVAIGPRSRGDRASIVDFSPAIFNGNRAMYWKNRGIDSTMKEPRSRPDRTTIVDFFHESS